MSPNVTQTQSYEVEATTALAFVDDLTTIVLNEPQLMQRFESVYHIVQPVISWSLVGTGFLGIAANTLVLAVFIKMGFPNTFQISCAALAVSDIGCVIGSVLCGITTMSVFRPYFDEKSFYYFSNLLGGVPFLIFSTTTALFTAWISVERCLCVVFPIKVKFIITRKFTAAVQTAIFVISFSAMVFTFFVFRIESQPNPLTNSTLWSLQYLQSTDDPLIKNSQRVVKLLFGIIFPFISRITVAICTWFLVLELKKKRKQRYSAPVQNPTVWSTSQLSNPHVNANQSKDNSGGRHLNINTCGNQHWAEKEKRVIKVVLRVAIIFLACSVPKSVHVGMSMMLPDYAVGGSLRYLYLSNGLLCVFLSELNSSINIFVFALMGQNFQSTLRQMFC